jgi:chorismate synthase
MSANSFGEYFKISTFGESHGAGLGVVIDGCPASVPFDHELLNRWMQRRRPGSSSAVSARKESDVPEILSGVFENKTLGTPIAIIVRNEDAKSADYKNLAPRLGHADDVWRDKFQHVDPRGGGRSSGRETVARVMAGAVAEMYLRQVAPEMKVYGFVKSVGEMQLSDHEQMGSEGWVRVEKFLEGLKTEGESVGGVGEVRISHPPRGLGQPVFHKLKSDLAAAIMSIGAVVGFELGDGFDVAKRKGSETHVLGNEKIYGGIRGGISTGEDIHFRFAIKPTSSILDVAKKGRHDPCILLRALPVAEAMTQLVLADHVLGARGQRI